jgi:PAS domain S-box-containing protein
MNKIQRALKKIITKAFNLNSLQTDDFEGLEKKFSTLIEFAPDAFFQGDSKGNFITVNNKAIDLTGYSREELLTMNISNLFPNQVLKDKPLRYDLLKIGDTIIIERELIRKSGETITVEMHSKAMPDGTYQSFLRDINLRRNSEELVRISKARLQRAELASKSGNWELHLDNKTIIASEGAAKLYGVEKDKFDYEVIKKVPLPEYRSLLDSALKELIENNKPYDLEFKVKKVDTGEIIDIHSIANFEREKRILFGIIQDITERKKAEEVIYQSESNFRNLFEHSPVGISMTGVDGSLNANKSFCEIVGYSKDELKNLKWMDITHPDDINLTNTFIQSLINGEAQQMRFEKRFIHKNGDIVWVDLNSYLQRDKENNPKFLISALIDITQRKHDEKEIIRAKERAEESEQDLLIKNEEYEAINEELKQINEELYYARVKEKESELKYKMLYNNTPVMLQSANMEGKLLSVNDYWLQVMGYEINEVIGTKSSDYLTSESKKFYKDFINEFVQTGAINNLEAQAIKKNGETIDLLISSKILYDKEGKPTATMTNLVDITDKKQAELALQCKNEELKLLNQKYLFAKDKAEESDRLKTVFLQNMSHEIRTPMNAIMGFSDLLTKNFNDKEKLKKFTSIIRQRSSDLLELINDILDLSKIETGQLPVNIEECDINVLFTELYEFFLNHRQKINKTHIELQFVPGVEPQLTHIYTDKGKLKQIFINLIHNAFKFTTEGKIRFGYKSDENNNITFYVSDTGIGIPKEKHDLIFHRFMQIDTHSNQELGGTGLGLAIVKGLIGLLGGEIFLDSTFGVGSTFYFNIPYQQAVSIQEKHVRNLPDNSVNFKNFTLLIVEDDIYNAEYLKEVLAETQINILLVISANQAIELVDSGKVIDIILMDIRLGGMDGYEATVIIKKKKPEIKIIAQTAYATSIDEQNALNAGCDDYISKPVNNLLLISKIAEQLSCDKDQ